jgi:hypothetical protein
MTKKKFQAIPRLNYRDVQRIRARQSRARKLIAVGAFLLILEAVLATCASVRPAHARKQEQTLCASTTCPPDPEIGNPPVPPLTTLARTPIWACGVVHFVTAQEINTTSFRVDWKISPGWVYGDIQPAKSAAGAGYRFNVPSNALSVRIIDIIDVRTERALFEFPNYALPQKCVIAFLPVTNTK